MEALLQWLLLGVFCLVLFCWEYFVFCLRDQLFLISKIPNRAPKEIESWPKPSMSCPQRSACQKSPVQLEAEFGECSVKCKQNWRLCSPSAFFSERILNYKRKLPSAFISISISCVELSFLWLEHGKCLTREVWAHNCFLSPAGLFSQALWKLVCEVFLRCDWNRAYEGWQGPKKGLITNVTSQQETMKRSVSNFLPALYCLLLNTFIKIMT